MDYDLYEIFQKIWIFSSKIFFYPLNIGLNVVSEKYFSWPEDHFKVKF